MQGYRILRKGEVLYSHGEASDLIYLIEEGTVQVKAKSGHYSLNAGDVVGAFDCCMERSYSADTVAETDAKLKIISKQDQLRKIDGTLTLKVLKAFMKNVDSTTPNKWS